MSCMLSLRRFACKKTCSRLCEMIYTRNVIDISEYKDAVKLVPESSDSKENVLSVRQKAADLKFSVSGLIIEHVE